MTKTKTIGQEANKQAKKYFEMYKSFAKDEDKKLRDLAETLATHDLLVKKIVTRMALEKLDKMIKKEVEK